jgi:hypothetical protein
MSSDVYVQTFKKSENNSRMINTLTLITHTSLENNLISSLSLVRSVLAKKKSKLIHHHPNALEIF